MGARDPRAKICGHALRGPPLPPPPWSMVQDAPPPVGWSVGSLFPLWGGCGGFGVLGLAYAFEGIRLQVDKGLGRVWDAGSLGLTVYVWFRPKACIYAGFRVGSRV